jgi:hypothetical protein
MIKYRAILTTQLLCVCLLACLAPARAELAPETRWADPSSVRLDVEFPGDGYHATWELFRCDCGDLLVRSELSIPGEVEKGETLLVEGRAILSRGFGEHQAELGSSLDAPALMMQLALRLLERSAPAGPSTITGPGDVAVDEQISPIHLDSGSAAGSFTAPWSVKGTIEPVGETKRRFDLQFRFSTGNPGEDLAGAMRLSGLAEYADTQFPLTPSSVLEGWQLNWRDEADPAAGAAQSAATLEELRGLIRANDQIR